jgi:hypothetical protein
VSHRGQSELGGVVAASVSDGVCELATFLSTADPFDSMTPVSASASAAIWRYPVNDTAVAAGVHVNEVHQHEWMAQGTDAHGER